MVKRVSRSISILLVIVMLAELFPTSLLGNFVQRVHAAETDNPAAGYSCSAPQETSYSINTDSLPTVVFPENLDAVLSPVSEPQTAADEGDGDTASGFAHSTAQEPQYPTVEPDEDDTRFVSLFSSYTSYSQMSEEDAAFLCRYIGMNDRAFLDMEELGYSLVASCKYAVLAEAVGCGPEDVLAAAPTEEAYQFLWDEIHSYKRQINPQYANTSLDNELRGWILQGYASDRVLKGCAVNQVTGVEMGALLAADDMVTYAASLDETTLEAVRQFSQTNTVSVNAITDYTVQNNLQASYFSTLQAQINNRMADLTAVYAGTGSGSTETADSHVSAPYTYQSNAQEQVSLNTGGLTYEETDYVLPGINGLDLTIGRRYSSEDAGVYQIYPEWGYRTKTLYGVTYGCEGNIIYFFGLVFPDFWCSFEKTEWYETQAEADQALALCRQDTETGACGFFSTHELTYYAHSAGTKEVHVYSYEELLTRKGTDHSQTDPFGLGNGWSFQFTWIGYENGECYLHLTDGSAYRINLDLCNSSHLVDYKKGDLRFERYYGSKVQGGGYRLVYQDGKCEYFDGSFNLIRIEDRYGNAIVFEHGERNGYPYTKITDTLGRVTEIQGQNTEAGHSMTVSLPDGVTLTYQVKHEDYDVRALEVAEDAVGQTTRYHYTVGTAATVYGEKDLSSGIGRTNLYVNLTAITHPTMARSCFEYEKVPRNAGEKGLQEHYRITRRYDQEGTLCLNDMAYLYSENDHTGYPAYSCHGYLTDDYRYSTTIVQDSSIRIKAYFDRRNLNTKTEYLDDSTLLEAIEYTYDSRRQPARTKISDYSAGNQTAPLQAIYETEYDWLGNLKNEWTAAAEGNREDQAHRISYTYDSKYGLLLTKTYQTDADATIQVQNTLDAAKKNIIRTDVYVNNVQKARKDYTYDTYGNVTGEKHYHDGLTDYDLVEYAYQDHAYLSQEKHSGILTTDGASAVSTPGQTSGTIATSYSYDTLGRMTASTDGSGNTTTYAYDALGNVTQVTNPDSSTVTYARNYTQNTVTVTDENGAQVKYTYTPLGLEFETVDVQTGSVMRRKEYDAQSRLIKVSDFVYGAVTEYTYDVLDRVTSETVKQGDEILSQTLYAYDDAAENGLYQKVTKTVVGDENAPSIVTTQYTDKNGNVVKTGRFLNGVEYFDTATYDYVGNAVTQLTAADAAKNLPFTAKYEYNENGQVTKTWNAENQYTTNTYDALGRLVQTTDYAGTPTTYTYDALGRLLTQTITIADGVTAASKYDYDASGNIIREWKPVHAVGSAAAWSKTEYAYNSRQNLTSVKQYDGNTVASETAYTYDAVGNLLTMTAGGNTTTYTYDRFGNTLSMTDALGQAETYTYSALGKPLTKTDRNGQTTSYGYDAAGRQVSACVTVNEETACIQTAYTLTGQIRTEENGWQRTTYIYDELGQAVQVEEAERNLLPDAPESDPEPEPEPATYTVTLNPNGGTVSPTSVEVTVGSTYSLPTPIRSNYRFLGWYLGSTKISNGDVVELTGNSTFLAKWREITVIPLPTDPNRPVLMSLDRPEDTASDPDDAGPTDELISYTKTYSYDLAGNRVGFQLVKSGETVQNVSYTYDDLNRLSTVSEGGSLQATYTYDTNGNRASLTYSNGTVETYTYNLANWITELENKKGNETLSSFSYTYYASGSQKSETDHTGKVTGYIYDGLGRLTQESETNGLTVNYTYDAAGNRSQMAVTGTETYTTVYAYDANNRLLTEYKTGNGETVITTYTYDANGNTLSKSIMTDGNEDAGSTTYTYNGFNQLIALTVDGTDVAYAYNAQGIRTAKRVNNLRTAFLLDGGNVIAEVQSNTVTDSYLRGVNLVRRESNSETEYYLFNAHGDVVTTTNLNGTVNQEYDYDAFGNEKDPDNLDTNPFRYCGEYLDAETGDYYLRARYYDPTIGRFTQEDTHWNTVNGIYGDSSQQYHYRDALGTAIYVCIPNITAIAQSGNLYLYCINSPILYHDALGLSFRVVGFGLQLDGSFSLAVATAGLGFEAVIYTDSLICGDSDALLCVYYYGGGGGTLDLDRLSSQLLTDPNIVSLVQKPVRNTEISLSASVSVVTGSEAFTSPKDYEGPFETFSITVGHAKVAYSYSETSRVYSAGVSTSSTSVSKTDTKYRLVATVPINFAQTVTPTAPASLPQQTATISMPGLHPASRPNQHRVDMLY